jgi:hypothetical protein
MTTPKEVLEKLEAGEFATLIGLIESALMPGAFEAAHIPLTPGREAISRKLNLAVTERVVGYSESATSTLGALTLDIGSYYSSSASEVLPTKEAGASA